MLSVTKVFEICYAHHLPRYDGPCQYPHGHTAKVEITFGGQLDNPPYPGMVVDFKQIKDQVGPIVKRFDHVDLNFVFQTVPTVENLCLHLVRLIQEEAKEIGRLLIRVRIWESSTSYATWERGEE